MTNSVMVPDSQTIETLLQQQFVKPKRTWFQRLMRDEENWNCQVDSLYAFNDGGFFERNRLLRVSVNDLFLEEVCLPGRRTVGIFAYDSTRLLYLQGDPATRANRLQELLTSENRPLDDADAEKLGRLFSTCLLDRRNDTHDVILSLTNLNEYGRSVGQPYTVDSKEVEKISDRLSPPAIIGSTERGWRLSVVTVFGWKHNKEHLILNEFRITPDFEITVTQKVLSKCIFSQMPTLRY